MILGVGVDHRCRAWPVGHDDIGGQQHVARQTHFAGEQSETTAEHDTAEPHPAFGPGGNGVTGGSQRGHRLLLDESGAYSGCPGGLVDRDALHPADIDYQTAVE